MILVNTVMLALICVGIWRAMQHPTYVPWARAIIDRIMTKKVVFTDDKPISLKVPPWMWVVHTEHKVINAEKSLERFVRTRTIVAPIICLPIIYCVQCMPSLWGVAYWGLCSLIPGLQFNPLELLLMVPAASALSYLVVNFN